MYDMFDKAFTRFNNFGGLVLGFDLGRQDKLMGIEKAWGTLNNTEYVLKRIFLMGYGENLFGIMKSEFLYA